MKPPIHCANNKRHANKIPDDGVQYNVGDVVESKNRNRPYRVATVARVLPMTYGARLHLAQMTARANRGEIPPFRVEVARRRYTVYEMSVSGEGSRASLVTESSLRSYYRRIALGSAPQEENHHHEEDTEA